MSRVTLRGPTIRAALILGFGVTLGLWLFLGYGLTRRMTDAQTNAATINQRYIRAQESLATVRTQVLVASMFWRDALLDPDARATDGYRARVEESFVAADQALRRYVPVLGTDAEREQIARLHREITSLRAAVLEVLAGDQTRWQHEARTLLRQILPKREMTLRISEEVQAINRVGFVRQQAALTESHARTQQQVWRQLGVAVAASFAIALLATLYAGRLEDRIRRQGAKEEQTARELQRLSTQLINAQEDERRSVSRELHDEVGQLLMAIKMELAIARRAIAPAGQSPNPLEEAEALADAALHSVRDLSHLLHPALLDDLGLPAAVDSYVQAFSKRHGIRAELLHERMDERLAPEIEAALYRIVQEALTNVVKHAEAQTCRVYLQRLPNRILMTVEDDGQGFDTADIERAGVRRGLGLIGIRERVVQLCGTLRLESGPDRGTRLTVEVPLQVSAPPADVDEADGLSADVKSPEVASG